MRDAAWSIAGDQLCVIASSATQGSNSGDLGLFVGRPEEPIHQIAKVGKPGTVPSIASCDPGNGRIVVVNAVKRTEGLGGTPRLAVVGISVISFPTGTVAYSLDYGVGNTYTLASKVAASATGSYFAENRNGNSDIRDLSTGKIVATLMGITVLAFSGDSGAVLVAGTTSDGKSEVLDRATGRVVWRSERVGQWAFYRPGAPELVFGVVNPHGGLTDLVVVGSNGTATEIAQNIAPAHMCPCPGANAY